MVLRRYLSASWRWSWLLVLCAALAGWVSYTVSLTLPRLYQATSTLLVSPANSTLLPDDGALNTAARLAVTYVDLIRTPVLLNQAASSVRPGAQFDQLGAVVNATYVRDTGFIDISVEHVDPELARDLANALADTFILQMTQTQQTRFQVSGENLSRRMAELSDEIDRRGSALNALRASIPADGAPDATTQDSITRVTRELGDLQQLQTSVQRAAEDLRLAQARSSNTISVVQPALLPITPTRPNVMLNTILAASLALLIALSIVVALERMQDLLSSPEWVDTLLGLPTLAVVGEIHKAGQASDETSDAYQVLRANIQGTQSAHSVVVTSATGGEGKTVTARNLATALAQAGSRTLLVDADLRNPTLHAHFEVPNLPGFSRQLLDGGPASSYIQPTKIRNLFLLSGGTDRTLLGSRRLPECLAELAQQAEWVVLDSPPVLAGGDALSLAPHTGATLLVINARATRASLAVRARNALLTIGVQPLGVVLNRVSSRNDQYYAAHASPARAAARPGAVSGVKLGQV
jgi:tyrosine-protein kinase